MRLFAHRSWMENVLLASALCLLPAMLLAFGVGPRSSQAGTPASPSAQQAQPERQELLLTQSQQEVDRKSNGCRSCHSPMDSVNMHAQPSVHIGCTDCHGGNAEISVPANTPPQSAEYKQASMKAHV